MRAAGWLAALLTVFGLPGAASAQPDPRTYALVEESTFQRGCFEPCECPIGQERPMVGTFSLTPVSDNGLFAEYAMTDVHWKVQGNVYATPPDPSITGSGTYTIGGEFAIQQQMEADLAVASEPPAHFDSERVVGGGGFPDQIDIEISQNGKYCFDTVMHVVARAQPDCDPASPSVAYCPEPGRTALLASGAIALALLRRQEITRRSPRAARGMARR